MKKLFYLLLPVVAVVLFGCSSATSEEDEPAGIGTTIRASAFFSEVGSTDPLSTIVVGRAYNVNFAPFCTPSLIDFVQGSVGKVSYFLDVPYKGKEGIGASEKEPFTIQYTPTVVGNCVLTAEVELLPNDGNKWVEVETTVKVVEAEQ